MVDGLASRSIYTAARNNIVRISPHFYTKDEELELIVAEMKTIRDTRAFAAAEKVGAAF